MQRLLADDGGAIKVVADGRIHWYASSTALCYRLTKSSVSHSGRGRGESQREIPEADYPAHPHFTPLRYLRDCRLLPRPREYHSSSGAAWTQVITTDRPWFSASNVRLGEHRPQGGTCCSRSQGRDTRIGGDGIHLSTVCAGAGSSHYQCNCASWRCGSSEWRSNRRAVDSYPTRQEGGEAEGQECKRPQTFGYSDSYVSCAVLPM